MKDKGAAAEARWLLLIHQIPPRPAYLRVKAARRLHQVGAVAIKNTVYVLPRTDEAREDFEWTAKEIVSGGGEATICEARFVDGMSDAEVERLFNRARDLEYRKIADEAAGARTREPGTSSRLRRRLKEIDAVDFFGAPARTDAGRALERLEARLRRDPSRPPRPESAPAAFRGRTWVTRAGIGVDRMASAWLVRRFVDPKAKFLFVPGRTHPARAGQVRFDMFEGEFTHEGDRCTFEVLAARLGLRDPALRPIAEVIHDLDLKDGKFGREETPGLGRLVQGIALAHGKDADRLDRASAVLDDLLAFYRMRGGRA